MKLLASFITSLFIASLSFGQAPDIQTQKEGSKRLPTSKKEKKKLEKKFGKRRLREILPSVDAESFYYLPHFGSSRTLIGQYKKLDGLKIVTIGYNNSRMPLEKTEVKDAPAANA